MRGKRDKSLFSVFALILLTEVHHPRDVCAGDFEITPIFGYTFGGGFEDSVTGTDLDVDEGKSYGIILGLKSTDNSGVAQHGSAS